ncbi:sigma-70 family RNA polymerase sigma factor [Shimia sp. R9_3]|uniref:sigma-70 family RNA polymerase sigma factor n=1 Tax=Shimia sp. R9_3 TaxID=2821113 RepID=UPI001AD96A00|nr:sigma-70 family RNA polymerase sigma factor [Shimia sp. R9_3]MBO9401190.1 sigma-70 family RNA polymerase sigma factor [Shimia sp. R9_3]
MTAGADPISTRDFLSLRPRLFAVAYRMLGSVSDAEDIVQDCFIRWQQVNREHVSDPTGFLIKIATNLCLDRLRAAKHLRAEYPGEWLPEPILTDDPTERTDHDVSVALLLALERLTPLERAAFLLRDVFDVDYDEVATILERSPATCRKLVTRARSHLHEARPRSTVSASEGEAITLAFFQAARTGDTGALSRLLAENAQVIADGGGKAIAARRVIAGRERLVRFLAGIAKKQQGLPPEPWHFRHLNGLPAILRRTPEDGLIQTTALKIEDGQITGIYIVRNPEKTAHLTPVFDLPMSSDI